MAMNYPHHIMPTIRELDYAMGFAAGREGAFKPRHEDPYGEIHRGYRNGEYARADEKRYQYEKRMRAVAWGTIHPAYRF